MRIKIFTTGGSIDKYYSTKASDFIVSEPTIGQLLAEAKVSTDYVVESLLKKDSLVQLGGSLSAVYCKVHHPTA